jgi:hypothetical protein
MSRTDAAAEADDLLDGGHSCVRLAAAGRRARHRVAFEQAGPINVLADVRIVDGAAADQLRREQALVVAEVVERVCSARRSETIG